MGGLVCCAAQALHWHVAFKPGLLPPAVPDHFPCSTFLLQVAALPGWWSLPAVHSGHVYLVEGGYLLRPGPRLVEGAEVLLRIVSTATQQQQALQLQRLGPGAGAAATAGAGAAGLPAYPRGAVLKLSLHGGQRCRQRLLPNYFMPV